MKKINFSLALLLFVLQSFSQERVKSGYDKDYYLGKSAKLQTAAWVLAGTGAIAATAGILIINNNQNSGDLGTSLSSAAGGLVITVAGVAAIVTSIPLFIVSRGMKRKAERLSFNNQRILMPVQNSFVSRVQPTLTLSIRL